MTLMNYPSSKSLISMIRHKSISKTIIVAIDQSQEIFKFKRSQALIMIVAS